MPVPLFASSLERYRSRLAERLEQVLASGRYVLGPELAAFEEEFASHLGVGFCVGVANGTDAITIALRALGVRPGDEVVVPSFTFYATAEAAVAAGAKPVFCDVDPETFCVTPESVERAIGPRTKAIVPVHLFGNVAPVPELRAFGLPILEDAAQAAGAALNGAKTGALGDAATFSFFPAKNLPCLGDGGAIVTDDETVAARARLLRSHGSEDKARFTEVGYNSRLDELQATVLRVLLPELEAWTASRTATADAYAAGGLGDVVALPRSTSGARHAYHLYVVRHDRPDELVVGLERRGIGARGYYRRPIHRQPAMAGHVPAGLELPGTEEAARTSLALPMGTELDDRAVREVVQAVRECASGST
jgi:dTDP-3-amino-3,4,6-trideoxy-alpha-D-glucose transaminase